MNYYGTFFNMTTVSQIKVERGKPIFSKDEFAYKVYTDQYVHDPVGR